MYEYGPNHPICQKFVEKKVLITKSEGMEEKDTGLCMLQLRQEGFSFEEIANVFDCYPSTVRRRIHKAEKRKREGYNAPA